MKDKYQSPEINIYDVKSESVICSSYCPDERFRCNDNCHYWHICHDRNHGKYCRDKKL